eukprot:symbB.v1.2.023876.t1/scaffold2206.1/size85813/3
MASSSSGKYDGVIKSGLKLKGGDKNKEVGVKVAKKKKKTQEDVLTEELQANAEQESQEQAELQKGAAQGPTTAQKTFQLAREKRGNQRINEAIKYTHRQRMDKLNAHLGSLSEHFDIPKAEKDRLTGATLAKEPPSASPSPADVPPVEQVASLGPGPAEAVVA